MKYDVIIIGSGLGGLECGYILSRMGKNVLLLEKEAHLGGCLYCYRRKGHLFDIGIHYAGGLGEGASLHAVYDYLGFLKLPWHRMGSVFDRVYISDRQFDFAQGFDAFLETMTRAFPHEREALKQYVAMLKDAEKHDFDTLNPRNGDPSYMYRLFGTGAYPWLTALIRDPLLVNVLSGASLKMELRKETLPLFTFAHGNAAFIESSWRLQGGSLQMADTLATGIREHGGTILLRSEVEELIEKDGRLQAVRCRGGEVYEGEAVISDVHPATTCGWIKESRCLRRIYRRRMDELENTFGMFTASLLLKPGTLPYAGFNRYIYKDNDVWNLASRNIPVKGVLVSCHVPDDGSIFARQVDLLTPMAWSRCAPWIATTTGHRGEAYEAMKQAVAEECIALAEEVVPGLRHSIQACYTSTPLTFRDYTRSPEGSAYGVRKDFNHPMTTVLSTRTPIPNLFMTGQNLMLHGLQGVTMTALFTCADVVGREAIWKIVE